MSYERNKVIGLLYRIFQAEEYIWFRNGQDIRPNFQEIEEYIEKLENDAYQNKNAVESGRIRVVYDKLSHTYEYYLNLGID